MANASDLFVLEFIMPAHEPTVFYPEITARLISEGIHHSTIFTGWGQENGNSEILCTISFSAPKNTVSDASVQQLGNDIAAILQEPLLTINKSETQTLFQFPA
jgi:hypothetical protein